MSEECEYRTIIDMKRFMKFVVDNYVPLIRLFVYLLITIASTIYVFCNWDRATSFTFFSEFNGVNLIFVVWIVLLLMPIITRFEGFGLNFTSLFHDLVQQKIAALGVKMETTIQKDFEQTEHMYEQIERRNESYQSDFERYKIALDEKEGK